jgi:hypothetical protein
MYGANLALVVILTVLATGGKKRQVTGIEQPFPLHGAHGQWGQRVTITIPSEAKVGTLGAKSRNGRPNRSAVARPTNSAPALCLDPLT